MLFHVPKDGKYQDLRKINDLYVTQRDEKRDSKELYSKQINMQLVFMLEECKDFATRVVVRVGEINIENSVGVPTVSVKLYIFHGT